MFADDDVIYHFSGVASSVPLGILKSTAITPEAFERTVSVCNSLLETRMRISTQSCSWSRLSFDAYFMDFFVEKDFYAHCFIDVVQFELLLRCVLQQFLYQQCGWDTELTKVWCFQATAMIYQYIKVEYYLFFSFIFCINLFLFPFLVLLEN